MAHTTLSRFVIATTMSAILSMASAASESFASKTPIHASAQERKVKQQTPRRRLSANTTTYRDVAYATVAGKQLQLDLYVPKTTSDTPPLLVWIHGGGWLSGSKDSCKMSVETKRGYAVASLNYRLSQEAIFPAQIHDCKGAIRWLRANADKYGYNADRIGVAGSSAGGQLASLLGTSGGVKELEGDVGGNLDQSSTVQAVCNYFGATDFHSIGKQRTKVKSKPSSVVTQLFGGTIQEKPDLARLASPVTFLDPTDPAFLLIHGAQDNVVPLQQSTSFEKLLAGVNVPVKLVILKNAGHGGKQFASIDTVQHFQDFFDRHVKRTP